MTQADALYYTIKAKGCVTRQPHPSENASKQPAAQKKKGRREAGLS
jgi:hypothetical protein